MIVLLPFRLLLLPPKVAWGTTKAGYRTARFVGFGRLAILGLGIGIGLLIAPVPGAEMRRKIERWLADAGLYGDVAAVPPVTDRFAASPNGSTTAPLAAEPTRTD
ncbi:MAG TPA: hypothetical protein VGA13_03530 [Acidimicrobiales bacterium]|jgi:hypothetical protein